jgi:hypothetical protein
LADAHALAAARLRVHAQHAGPEAWSAPEHAPTRRLLPEMQRLIGVLARSDPRTTPGATADVRAFGEHPWWVYNSAGIVLCLGWHVSAGDASDFLSEWSRESVPGCKSMRYFVLGDDFLSVELDWLKRDAARRAERREEDGSPTRDPLPRPRAGERASPAPAPPGEQAPRTALLNVVPPEDPVGGLRLLPSGWDVGPTSANRAHQTFMWRRWASLSGVGPRAATLSTLRTIVDFGAGYGGLARTAERLGFRGRYVLFDLPAQTALQRFYLESLGLPVRGETEWPKHDFGFWCVSDWSVVRRMLAALPRDPERTLFVNSYGGVTESTLRARAEYFGRLGAGGAGAASPGAASPADPGTCALLSRFGHYEFLYQDVLRAAAKDDRFARAEPINNVLYVSDFLDAAESCLREAMGPRADLFATVHFDSAAQNTTQQYTFATMGLVGVLAEQMRSLECPRGHAATFGVGRDLAACAEEGKQGGSSGTGAGRFEWLGCFRQDTPQVRKWLGRMSWGACAAAARAAGAAWFALAQGTETQHPKCGMLGTFHLEGEINDTRCGAPTSSRGLRLGGEKAGEIAVYHSRARTAGDVSGEAEEAGAGGPNAHLRRARRLIRESNGITRWRAQLTLP